VPLNKWSLTTLGRNANRAASISVRVICLQNWGGKVQSSAVGHAGPGPMSTRIVSPTLLGAVFAVSVVGFNLSALPQSEAQDFRDAAKAPPSWAQFAKLVKDRFETWLSADDEVSNRFRTYVIEHYDKKDGPPQTLVVRAWLNPDGTVERIIPAAERCPCRRGPAYHPSAREYRRGAPA
jgi:hypothetical protein